ncbi:hypothetical protein Tco_0394194 [Tanacetum coccineum]
MSTPVFVDLESSTQANGAQSSRVPIPLLEDPYEAIRQAYLDGTDAESEPFQDPIDTETPESPLTIAPPISLSESTPPVLVPILYRTACMAVRVPPVMSSDLFASIAEVTAMSESAFCASELVEDSEEEDDEEDEEIEKSMDSDNLSESHGMDDESRGLDDECHSIESDGLDLEEEEEEDVPGGQQHAALVVGIAMSAPLGLGMFEVEKGSGSAPNSERPKRVSASRKPTLTTWTDPEDGMVYIDVPTYPPPAPPVQTPPSPEWTSGSLPISPSPSIVPSPISSPMVPLTAPSPVASPATAETKGFLTELGPQVQMQEGLIGDHAVRLEELSPALFESDIQGENQDLRLQLIEERYARLELDEVVDSMRIGQEPRGGDIIGSNRPWMVMGSIGKSCDDQLET